MTAKKHSWLLMVFLIIAICTSLLNVTSVRADGETPTEPPAPTQVETEPTEPPVESTPEAVEATATPIAEVLDQMPEGTEVVVIDEGGETVPLATQEAAEIVEVVDPMWCPEGVLPGGPGCSTSFSTISALITNMVSSTPNYAQNGVIYFTASPGSGTFTLNTTTLSGGDFETLNDFNLTLQGGWNGLNNGSGYALSGQTNFGSSPVTIGTAVNPWVGSITLNDLVFSGTNQSALTVYTSTGNITLNNVDVNNQSNGNNTALLSTTSGNITVNDGIFDGNNSNSGGFSASTGTGAITINNTSFTENKASGSNTSNGATLSAPVVTLTNVTSTGNDANGIAVSNANVLTLNNVTASSNGTDFTPAGLTNNIGSGVFFSGNVGSSLIINGGTFNDNQEYGIELGNVANTTIYIQSIPTCTGNDSNAAPTSNCYNTSTNFDNTGPVITPIITGTAGSNGWYTSNVSVSWSVTDPESGILSSTNCGSTDLSSETTGVTITCSATNNANLSNSVSVTIKIDKTNPTLSLPANITAEATGPAGAVVSFSASATDNLDGAPSVSCSAASGATFGLGSTTVSCTATDAASNASSGSFQVTVQDTTGPSLSLPGNITVTTPGTSQVVTYSASASDLVDGSVSVTCSPASGFNFPAGWTTVNCSATDSHSNTANGSFIVNVQDAGGPMITVPANITAEATSPAGAAVSYSASAIDSIDGPVAVSCSPAAGSTFPLGTTTVVCSATDLSANTNTVAFLVTVQDTTAPGISGLANINVSTNNKSGKRVTFATPTTSDAVDGAGVAACLPASNSMFPVGTTTVVCTATDSRGNSTIGTFSVVVMLTGNSDASTTGSSSSSFVVPVTGGAPLGLSCDSAFWAFGIKLSFTGLCDYQTTVDSVGINSLPGALPDGSTFVNGLDLSILSDNQEIEQLPDGTSIQLDFPLTGGSADEFTVLRWNGSQWEEVSPLGNDTPGVLQILSTQEIGIFVLVKK